MEGGLTMKTEAMWRLLDEESLKKIDGTAVKLLGKSGIRIDHPDLLEKLEAVGCGVDRGRSRCRIPEPLVRRVLDHVGGTTKWDVELPAGWSPRRGLRMGGSYPHLLEWPSGHRRLATRRDLEDLGKLSHGLDEFTGVGRVVVPSDVEARIEPLWSTRCLAGITDKPILGGEVLDARVVEPLVRMGEVLSGKAGDTSLIVACDFFIAPLHFDGTQADCFLEKRRFGLPNVPGTMPISGMSSPVTPAGTAAVAAAELLAGWVMGYAVAPELPVSGIVSSGSLDMRTATARFGSPEALLQDAAVVQLCRRFYGIRVSAATGYVDAKRPGLEAAFQKLLPLAAAPYGVGSSLSCLGLLSAGQDYSPVQHLLDAEMSEAIERFQGGFAVTDETLAFDLIEEMVERRSANFLDTEHTARYFASEQWYPRWFDRSGWRGEEEKRAEEEMLRRMSDYCRSAVRSYRRPAIDEGKLKELDRIFRSTEEDLLGAGTRTVPIG